VRRLTVTLAVAYVGLAILANWLAATYIVHVPFTPYLAPGGVFCIGAILVIRDWLQQLAGLWFSLALVAVASVASYVTADVFGWTSLRKIAVASFVAFVVSETVEAAVFTPIRRRSLTAGVALSGVAGSALDSWLFLTLAFGSLAYWPGQFWAKTMMVAVGTVLTAGRRYFVPVRV
jgi:uncharacterized PurR-regulated membrane protein YhhQ (DUF165 family)